MTIMILLYLEEGNIKKDKQELESYQKILNELSVAKYLVLRGNLIVVPKTL